jgi:hypothetical protein
MPLFLDIYFTYWYRYNMEVDEEKSDTYNILLWVCLWFCRLDVVFFDYFSLILLEWIAGEEEEERAVVSSASSVSSTETRQVLMTSPRRPSSTVRKQENEIKCRLLSCRTDLFVQQPHGQTKSSLLSLGPIFPLFPARLSRLVEFIPWNQFRGPINI